MKWLQWSDVDLRNGPGGVEVHARCLNRELTLLGVETHLSSERSFLNSQTLSAFDVVQTHGSSFPPSSLLAGRGSRRPVWIHTLHGTTLGRMNACGEWLWVGGYLAQAREIAGIAKADLIASVHPELWVHGPLQKLGKKITIVSNGWDSATDAEISASLPERMADRLATRSPYWIYVGRSEDAVKNTGLLKESLDWTGIQTVVAVPGTGFESDQRFFCTGGLPSHQVSRLMRSSSGLLLTSKYEGLPLVVLEALAQGVPVVSTSVGGISTLDKRLQGIDLCKSFDPREFARAIQSSQSWDRSISGYKTRAMVNRNYLNTWNQVARKYLGAVELAGRRS